MWNTGCNNIVNALETTFNIVNGEDQGLAITVPKGGIANWQSVVFPWCSNHKEVASKAFRVRNMEGTDFLYLFQEYSTNRICWSLGANRDLFLESKYLRRGAEAAEAPPLEPFSAIDIYILPDFVFGFAAESENRVVRQVLDGIKEGLEITTGVIAVAASVSQSKGKKD